MDLDTIYIFLISLLLVEARVYQSHINRMSTFLCAMCPFTHTRSAIGGMCRYRALRSLHNAPMWSFFFPSSSKMSRVESEDVEGEVVVVVVGWRWCRELVPDHLKREKKQPCSRRGKTPFSPPPNPTTPTTPPSLLLLLPSVPDCLV